MYLSNSKLKSYNLGVDFVLPLSQDQEQQPPPKFTRRKSTKGLEIAQLGLGLCWTLKWASTPHPHPHLPRPTTTSYPFTSHNPISLGKLKTWLQAKHIWLESCLHVTTLNVNFNKSLSGVWHWRPKVCVCYLIILFLCVFPVFFSNLICF